MTIKSIKNIMTTLINSAVNYDLNTLSSIYHDDMTILMIDADGNLSTSDKSNFMAMFETMKKQGVEVDSWAQYNDISVGNEQAHVLITRKNNLAGYDSILVLSIDFIFEHNRWQIIREVIYVRPDTGEYPGEENINSYST
ncbi:nuclear transport factor 2 family protein [Vibrio sp. Vb339]|uniref:nuclear transport factor 2 family protein n=1 Tax=Vibrio sp. Vb339 TaxID=1192013 RepID=UPI001553D438|nr:nuclear transport factor 2 family protein [Vibrio sp. Vb339]